MRYKLFLLALLFSATAFVARANNGTPPSTEENRRSDINGGVVDADTKKPLVNVSVTAYSGTTKKEKVVYTDANGNYSFTELKAGMYKLVFEKDGFKRVTREKVTIRPDEGCQLNVELDDEDEFQLLPGSIFDFD